MVLIAENGEKALQICNTHQGDIEVMITDINMPGMNGIQLATRVKAGWPALRLVFISGFMDFEDITKEGFSQDDTVFIEKPFDLVIVEDTIHKVLETSQ